MPRAIWSGSISFGLVNIPVKLFTAVSHKEVRFHMLHDADGARIEMKRFCSAEQKEVPYEHVVKGYEVGPNRYVTVSPDEFQALDPKATHSIDIHDFVGLEEIDPIYYETTYYLMPDKGAAKAYALLHDAMRDSRRVALATMVLRTKQYLCSVRPLGGALAMSTMNYADEIVPESDLGLAEGAASSGRELEMARQLIESLAGPFEPAKYHDTYREKVLEMIERKAQGEQIVAPAAEEAAPAQVVNLADALAASLAAARKRAGAQERERPGAAPERGERHRPRAQAAHTAGKRSRRRS